MGNKLIILRSLIFNILFFLLSLFIGILFSPFLISKKITVIVASYWAKITLYFLKIICKIEIKIDEKFLLNKKKSVLAIRHESILDTILFIAYFPNVKYIVKKELLYVPFYGLFVWRCGHIIIDRQGKSTTLNKMINLVRSNFNLGMNVIIFPHGTRVKSGLKVDVKSGIYAFYKYLNIPITPVHLSTGLVWDRKGFIKRPGIVEVKFDKNINLGINKEGFLRILNLKLN